MYIKQRLADYYCTAHACTSFPEFAKVLGPGSLAARLLITHTPRCLHFPASHAHSNADELRQQYTRRNFKLKSILFAKKGKNGEGPPLITS